MEVLTLFGVVSKGIPVMKSGWRLIRMMKEIQGTGSTTQHTDLECSVKELEQAISELETSTDPPVTDDDELAIRLREAAKKLQKLLDKCKCQGKGNLWNACIQAAKTSYHKSDILGAEKSVQRYMELLQFRVITDMSRSEDERNKKIARIMDAALKNESDQNARWESFYRIVKLNFKEFADSRAQIAALTTELRSQRLDAEAVQRVEQLLTKIWSLLNSTSAIKSSAQV
jgi:hypothetical protein